MSESHCVKTKQLPLPPQINKLQLRVLRSHASNLKKEPISIFLAVTKQTGSDSCLLFLKSTIEEEEEQGNCELVNSGCCCERD